MNNHTNLFDLIKKSSDLLKNAGIEDSKSDIEILLSSALGIKRNRLYFEGGKLINAKNLAKFDEYMSRRIKREPVCYILGISEFMGLDFIVDKNVLIPRPETELLVEKILEIGGDSSSKSKTVLDLCCGSGNIAISLAKLGSFESICGSDISPAALDIAKQNACLHKVDISFIRGDLFENLGGRKFDIIASNPPYIGQKESQNLAAELSFEPQTALFAPDEGLFFYKRIAGEAKKYLKENGHILVELNALKADETRQIFAQKGYGNLEIIKDYAGLDRILWIKS